jgi:hypothetical protein
VNTIKDRIKATKAQLRIAMKHYNQAERTLERLIATLARLEDRHALQLARAEQKAKPTKRK